MIRQILYIFDPLCGWCYGFSETIWSFYQQHRSRYDFIPIVGGMITGSRIGPASDMYDYLKQAIPRLETTTGCKMGQPYMDMIQSDKVIFNSEPPCRAVVTFRSIQPQNSLSFVRELQKAHFQQGKDYNNEDMYATILSQFEVDPEAFYTAYASQDIQNVMQQDFDWVSQARINGFPCVVVNIDNHLTMLASGYTPLDRLNETLEAIEQESLQKKQ